MPGPGKQKGKKQRSNQGQSAVANVKDPDVYRHLLVDTLVNNIEEVEGWPAVAHFLCEALEVPDLESRAGLKKIHKDFSKVYDRLNAVYTQYHSNDKIVGGIVGVYAKMCSDSILRNKLFREKDILAKLIPLLDRPACSRIVLHALCAITAHGGEDVRLEISKKTSALLRLLEEEPDNSINAELVIIILGHTATAVVSNEHPPDPKLLKAIDVPRLIRVLLCQLRKSNASTLMVDHALQFLSNATRHCSEQFKAIPSALNLLVACTRSKDMQTRCVAICSILRLNMNGADKEDLSLDPQKLMALAKGGIPRHLSDAIADSVGPFNSDMFRILLGAKDFTKAISGYAGDRDMLKLAKEIGRLVLLTEFSVVNGCFQTQNPRSGQMEQFGDMPFIWWMDALPHCAKELRARGTPEMLDMADIIDLKYMILKRQAAEAQPVAKRAISRNPRVGFFYYIVTLSSDLGEALRAAKKGLKCPNLTAYVRNSMLFRGSEVATTMGLEILESAHVDEHRWNEGVAFIMSALEDAKTFINEAPPDTRSLKSVIYIHAICTLILHGSELGPELHEFQDTSNKLKLAQEYAVFMGMNHNNTHTCLTREMIVKRMSAAAREWDNVIAGFQVLESRTDAGKLDVLKAEDDLVAWLENANLEECHAGHNHTLKKDRMTHPKVDLNGVELYQCSWCSNPSAVLRKCSACEKTRYCDSHCQKEHWKLHRKACASKSS